MENRPLLIGIYRGFSRLKDMEFLASHTLLQEGLFLHHGCGLKSETSETRAQSDW